MATTEGIHTLSPHCSDRRAVLLGEDEDGLAAVTVAEVDRNASEIVIECVAVARRLRGVGGAAADEAMDQIINWAVGTADDAGYRQLLLLAKTDRRNSLGISLVRRSGFGIAMSQDSAHIYWQQKVDIGD